MVKHSSIRIVLALVAQEDMELEQLDVRTAFLHGELDEQIHMTQPEGFIKKGEEEKVCLLKRSLYGLKQSPRQWYKRFDTFIVKNGFKRCEYDGCVYLKNTEVGAVIYLLLYVDDMLVACNSKTEIEKVKVMLESEFEMKNMGAASKILGMQITRDRSKGTLFINQKSYIAKVLKKFRMDKSKAVMTPMAQHFKLSQQNSPKTEEEEAYMQKIPYANAVGSVMYVMICTRPDLAYAMSLVSRYMGKPGKLHWEAMKWIFRYLKGTSEVGLMYLRHDGSAVTGFVDSDYAGCLDSRRSLTGYVFQFCGNTVSWKCNLQHVVSLSTTEAEFIAVTEAIKEAIWMKGMAASLKAERSVPKVFCDSQSGIHLAKNQVYHERTKHIDVKLHFVRDVVANGEVILEKISTNDNPADALTKALPGPKFKYCLKILQVV